MSAVKNPYNCSQIAIGSDYTDEELAFIRAVDEHKQRTGRRFPSLTELLAILKALGYRQEEHPSKELLGTLNHLGLDKDEA